MQIGFYGATHEVTGSCYMMQVAGSTFLIDCGMEQGPDYYENKPLPVTAKDIDFVLLTHAHIDHSGNLPRLYAEGFTGQVYATYATESLCDIMLRDSAHIQMFEAEWKNRKAKRAGQKEVQAAYTMEDAQGVLENFVGCPYHERMQVAPGVAVRFTDAGHLLGSASIEVWAQEEDKEVKVVFSGDIGNLNQPLILDPVYIDTADYVVMESTYGERSHPERPDYVRSLAAVIQETFDRGGNLIIPSFAVGRTQEMLYFIRQIKEQNLIKKYPDFPVYVDSPLAVEATTIFGKYGQECYDEEAVALLQKGINPIGFPGLRTSVTSEDSKAINFDKTPKIIISASGMCDAGRVKHHLKHNLWREESTVLFVGYQAVGTLGRSILEGAQYVKIFQEEVKIRAKITQLEGISGHADDKGLLAWAGSFQEKPRKVFVTHGDDQVTDVFARRLTEELGYETYAPYSGTVYDLLSGQFVVETKGELLQKRKEAAGKKESAVYAGLMAAGQRLLEVIRHNREGANQDLRNFTEEIEHLAERWER
ncbi:MAG: MBL fold metallo-hydrolase RNA specificity domain-containing protein [Lachnospiraceae bacterium]